MKRAHLAFSLRWVVTAFAAFVLLGAPSRSHGEDNHGRLLYAADDDWDWASPEGAGERSGLSRYGKMSWSGLDWLEEGLDEVRGVLFGSAPPSLADLELKGLSELRGEHAHYEVHPPKDGAIAELLQREQPPNLIILMQNKGADVVDLAAEDATSLVRFVEAGGRLLVLDDWQRYVALFNTAIESALKHSPRAVEDPAAEKVAELDPDRVKALVAQLAADDFAVRAVAKAELIEMGPGIFKLIDMKKERALDQQAHLTQIRAALFPKKPAPVPPQDTNNYRDYVREIERITAVTEKLTAARVEHRVEEVLVNKGGWPLPALMLRFNPKATE